MVLLTVLLLTISITPVIERTDAIYVTKKILGPQRTIIITVEFPDRPLPEDFILTRDEKIPVILEELNDYYRELSYNQMWFEGDITNKWYMLNASAHYTYTMYPDLLGPHRAMIRDAIKAADEEVDFSEYDVIIVLGLWNADVSDIKTAIILLDANITTDDGVVVNVVTQVWVNLAQVAHEVGHIFALPDLYEPYSSVGNWDLMGRANLVHLLAWCKIKLGWIRESQVYQASPERRDIIVVDPIERWSNGTLVVKIPLATNESYLIEVRQPIGYDGLYDPSFIGLPNPSHLALPKGVLISHVNETLQDFGDYLVGYPPVYAHQEVFIEVQMAHSMKLATFNMERRVFIDQTHDVSVIVLEELNLSYRILVTDAESGEFAQNITSLLSKASMNITQINTLENNVSQSLLEQAEKEYDLAVQAFGSGNFQSAYEYVKEALSLIEDVYSAESASSTINEAKSIIEEARGEERIEGLSEAETLIQQAENAYEQGYYLEAKELAEQAKSKAHEAIIESATSAMNEAQSAIEKARGEERIEGLSEAETLLTQAENIYNQGNYLEAKNLAEQAKSKAYEATIPFPTIPLVLVVGSIVVLAVGILRLKKRKV